MKRRMIDIMRKLFVLEPNGSQELDNADWIDGSGIIMYFLVEGENIGEQEEFDFQDIKLFAYRSQGVELKDVDEMGEKDFEGEISLFSDEEEEETEYTQWSKWTIEYFESLGYKAERLEMGAFLSELE
jgi:hypothetical protein